MTWSLLAAVGIAVWTLSLFTLTMTATSQSSGRRSLLETLVWKRACSKAAGRLSELQNHVDASTDISLPADDITWAFLRREDVLYQASDWAFRIKVGIQLVLTSAASAALWGITFNVVQPPWRNLLALSGLLTPLAITSLAIWLTLGQGMGRWTTETVTAAGRRAYEALLRQPPDRTTTDPVLPAPFHDAHVQAARALEYFARALDRYALDRALPDGRNPMPQVVAHFCAAAALVRELRDNVELDRVDGRKPALREVQRLLATLASGRLHDLAPGHLQADSPLLEHRSRHAWRRQALRLGAYTACLGGIIYAAASSAVGVAIASAVVTAALTAWDRMLWLHVGHRDNSSSGRPG